METLNQRISKIIEYSGLSLSEFADSVEVQRSSISHITSGRNKPSLEFVMKIKNRFPEMNLDWIVLGTGEMMADEAKIENQPEEKPQTSLPDLFSIISDENFGKTETDKKTQKQTPRELPETEPISVEPKPEDSQRLGNPENKNIVQSIEDQPTKIKRIVMFFENGKFESFEP